MRKLFLTAVTLALIGVSWSEAADQKHKNPSAAGVETKNVGGTLPSKLVALKVAKLTGQLDWQFSLDEAKSLAQRLNRAILWLHVLGDLDKEC
jgi:hypothetical protein